MKTCTQIAERLAEMKRESAQTPHGDSVAIDDRLDELLDIMEDLARRVRRIDASLDRIIEGGGG